MILLAASSEPMRPRPLIADIFTLESASSHRLNKVLISDADLAMICLIVLLYPEMPPKKHLNLFSSETRPPLEQVRYLSTSSRPFRTA